MYQIVVFVPSENKENVKDAMFNAGAGRIGNYSYCCFELEGQGQFCPMPGSRPYIGKSNNIEYVKETRIELVCDNKFIKDVIKAINVSHPYETPAFYITTLANDELE